MIGAGDLRGLFTFKRRGLDGNGDRLGDWDGSTAFTMAARIVFIRGGENVLQDRLQGVQPVALTVRDCAAVRALDNSWGAFAARAVVGVRLGDVFNITAVEQAQTKTGVAERGFLDVLATRDGSSGG